MCPLRQNQKTAPRLHYCFLMLLPCFCIPSFLDSVQFSCSVLFNSLQPHGLQHTRLPSSSPTPGNCSNSCPLSRWGHQTISSSVLPFTSWLQSFPASGSFPMSGIFTSGDQNIGASASASVLPMNIQDWFPLRWTGWISLQSKGLSRVFSNTTVQKHQFFSAQGFFNNILLILIGGELLYNTVVVLPYIHMNQPWVYMCSPAWTPLPPPYPSHPSGSPQRTLITLSHASNLDWQPISHMIIYMFKCYSLKSPHPRLLPQSPKVCSLHLCLFCCLSYRVIITIFLNSRYMC